MIVDKFLKLEDFLNFLGLDPAECPIPISYDSQYSFLVTRHFAGNIEKGNWLDPLLLQVLPLESENRSKKGFSADPVGDGSAEIAPGVIKKYKGRALIYSVGDCPIHCRFCFRRNTVHRHKKTADVSAVTRVVQKHSDIEEIIFSGGEPFLLSDQHLKHWFEGIDVYPQIKVIRFHTRMLSVFPDRVKKPLLSLFRKWEKRYRFLIVTHANHPNEIDERFETAVQSLRQQHIEVLNQSVLLKRINDAPETHIELNRRLSRMGVMPYYLHQLDKANGTAQFEVDESVGKTLYCTMRKELPGYALPKYVKEVPGDLSKVQIQF